jgi:hypothetical protein
VQGVRCRRHGGGRDDLTPPTECWGFVRSGIREQLDPGRMSRRFAQPPVARDRPDLEGLGKHEEGSVVGGHVVPRFQIRWLSPTCGSRTIASSRKVRSGVRGTLLARLPQGHQASRGTKHLDVDEVRGPAGPIAAKRSLSPGRAGPIAARRSPSPRRTDRHDHLEHREV